MQTLELPPLGTLIAKRPDWPVFNSKPIPVSYFDGRTIPFAIHGGKDGHKIGPAFTLAIENFIALTPKDRRRDTEVLYEEYFHSYDLTHFDIEDQYEGFSLSDLDQLPETEQAKILYIPSSDKERIWKYVDPKFIEVFSWNPVTVQVFAACAWTDPSGHDLEMRYPEGKRLGDIFTVG